MLDDCALLKAKTSRSCGDSSRANRALRQSAEDSGCPANALEPTSARSLGFPHQALDATGSRAEQA